jgi:hypothetical protein
MASRLGLQTKLPENAHDERTRRGTTMACGLVAGAALIRSGDDPEKVGQLFNWLGLIAFVLLGLLIFLDSRRVRPGAIQTH